MMTLRSILCPVDFSEPSQHALRSAVAIAAQYKSRLTVFTAVDPLLAHAAEARFSQDLAKDTETALREFVSAATPGAAAWAPPVGIDVQVGEASELIVDAAARQQADLVVMGTHGLGGFRKLLLGSTTERVLRRTQTPLLAVPLTQPQLVVIDPSGPRFATKTIVAATDFSEAAAAAVRCGSALAEERTAPFILVHVVAPVTVAARWQSYLEGVNDERMSQARSGLESVAAGLHTRQPPDLVVVLGPAAEAIAETAQQRDAGLIVMGLSGEQGAFAPRPGTIAYRVLCLAHVPVLVVPAGAGVSSS